MEQLRLWCAQAEPAPSPVALLAPEPISVPAQVLGPQALSQQLGRSVRLSWTCNHSTMISVRHRDDVLDLRLHRMFAGADPEIWSALVGYLRGGDRKANRTLDSFIAAHVGDWPPRRRSVRAHGRAHDLKVIFARLNAEFFHDACAARIGWGRAGPVCHRRSIQLGLYVTEEKLIVIHPSLDQSFVPDYYVAWIVFHEMLHDVFGIEQRRSRRSIHPPEFGALEQSFPDFARAKNWETQNLDRLLRFRRH